MRILLTSLAIVAGTIANADEQACGEAEAVMVSFGQFDASATRQSKFEASSYVWAIMFDAWRAETEMANEHFQMAIAADLLMFDCFSISDYPAATDIEALEGYRTSHDRIEMLKWAEAQL